LQFNVHSGYKCFVFQCTALQTFMQVTPRIYLAVVEIKRSLIPMLLPWEWGKPGNKAKKMNIIVT